MNVVNRIFVALLFVSPIVELAADEPPAKPNVKVEFFWVERRPASGVTADNGISWEESGEVFYLHKQPILSNKDVVKVDVNKTVFGKDAVANEQFAIDFQLTKEARKRLAETVGADEGRLMAAMIDGQFLGMPFYMKSRDAENFVPYAGMFSSKAKVDQIVATFAKVAQDSGEPLARPRVKVEFHWAEFKKVPGLTEDKGVPFGEGNAPLTYMHKKAILTPEDIAEARIGGTIQVGDGTIDVYGVNLYLTKEGKEKLARACEPGKKKVLVSVIDGRQGGSADCVDAARIPDLVPSLGYYHIGYSAQLVNRINRPVEAAAK